MNGLDKHSLRLRLETLDQLRLCVVLSKPAGIGSSHDQIVSLALSDLDAKLREQLRAKNIDPDRVIEWARYERRRRTGKRKHEADILYLDGKADGAAPEID